MKTAEMHLINESGVVASRNSKAGFRTRLSQTGAKLTLDLFEPERAEVEE